MDVRKRAILKTIIKEYVDTAKPVGSSLLVKKYHFELSAATIRNEMADLEKEGYLDHLYTSSGRIPTDKGYRYFVDELMEKRVLSSKERARLVKLLDLEANQIFKQTARILANLAHNLAIMNLEESFWRAGLDNLFSQPEFRDSEEILCISKVLDKLDSILDSRFRVPWKTIKIFIGKENPLQELENCSIIIAGLKDGKLAILGPKRMEYARNRSLLDFTSKLLNKLFT